MRRVYYINTALFVLCFGCALISFFYLDRPVACFFHALHLNKVLPVINWMTHLVSSKFELAVLIGLVVFFHVIYPHTLMKDRCCFLFCCVFIPSLICLILKILLGRARPELLFSDHVYGFYGMSWHNPAYWSFPSGHTTTIVGFFFGMSFIVPRYKYLWCMLAVLFMTTRVLLMQHYVSDVVATTGLTLLELFLMMHVMRRKGWFQLIALQKAV